jgi:hypothetical protein
VEKAIYKVSMITSTAIKLNIPQMMNKITRRSNLCKRKVPAAIITMRIQNPLVLKMGNKFNLMYVPLVKVLSTLIGLDDIAGSTGPFIHLFYIHPFNCIPGDN